MRILYIALLHDYLFAAFHNVRIHLLDDEAKLVRVTLEDLVHEFELVQVPLLEHVDATSVFRAHCICHFRDSLSHNYLEHFGLGLRLQPVVSVVLLVLQHLLNFAQIFRTVPALIPDRGTLQRFSLRGFEECSLKEIIVDGQVPVALPHEEALLGPHGLGLDQAQIHVHLDALFDCLFVNGVACPIRLNLLQYCLSDHFPVLVKHALMEHGHALFTDQLELVVLEVVAIEVLKAAVHHLRVDHIVVPHLH